jgi:hypothetical protein
VAFLGGFRFVFQLKNGESGLWTTGRSQSTVVHRPRDDTSLPELGRSAGSGQSFSARLHKERGDQGGAHRRK